MIKPICTACLTTVCMILQINTIHAQDTRLVRDPSISNDKISFVYAGDIWVADINGANVKRITAFEGVEADPHFSPDGNYIAFTAQYDGNTDVYIVSSNGGEPKRLTWHPTADMVRGWTPDGKEIYFASGRVQVPYDDPDQLWKISMQGGNATPFILPRAGNGKFSPDGKQFVYEEIVPWESEFRNYRGGQNSPLRIFDMKNYAVQKLPWENSRDIDPVWMNDHIYFLSDRDYAMNVWSYDINSKAVHQLTFFKEFDCKAMEGDDSKLIFENGGYLYTYTPGMDQPKKLSIHVDGDFPWVRLH